MNFRFHFHLLLVVLLVGALSACDKKKVEPIPPVDTVSEEPYQEHLEELNGSTEELEIPADADVILDTFQPGDVLTSSMVIAGKAKGGWYFEASFPVRVLNDKGDELVVTHAEAQEDWMQPGYVPFKLVIPSFDPGAATTGKLVIEKDNPSGLPENDKRMEVPVRFMPGATTQIKLFFTNSKLDPEMFDCGKVFEVPRVIAKTATVAGKSMEELLKGPTASEKSAGYGTSLNPGITINRLVIENGVAKVDFDEQLEREVGGSCRIQSIQSQIRTTLMQFPTVKDVVISIDGRTEDILQP